MKPSEDEHMQARRSILAHLPPALRPLSRRLPLVVLLVAIVMMAAVLLLGYRKFHELALENAAVQLESSANQLRASLRASVVNIRRNAAALTRIPELARAAGGLASQKDRDAASAFLAAHRARLPQTPAIGLWSVDGRFAASAGDPGLASSIRPSFTELFSRAGDTSTTVIAPLSVRGDSVLLSVVGRIAGVDGSPAGYVVSTRRLVDDPSSLGFPRGMVGRDARILVGNAAGDLWTDFERPVSGIGATPDSGLGRHVSAEGTEFLFATAPVDGTPWRVMVDVPGRWAATTARGFIFDMAIVALLLLLAGAALIWYIVRRSLRPLASVTAAVSAVARGDRQARVPSAADDEIGRLATAFNSMAAQVSNSAAEVAKRAEALEAFNEELRDSEERYRVLVDHLPDAILVHRDFHIVFANGACAHLFGEADAKDLVGRNILDFVGEGDHEQIVQRIQMVQKQGISLPRREIPIRRADGKRIVAEGTSVPLTIHGKASVQTILRDVTERLLLEEQLRQSQKMDAVGRLAGGVAHDFNNILTVIDAHAEFALRSEEGEEARIADIQEIRRAWASAAGLTRQLLAFSRKQAIAPVRVDLTESVEGMMTMFNRIIGEQVTISSNLAKPLWPVRADLSNVEQVLMNLTVNARDAMPNGGTLTYSTANIRIGPHYRTGAGELVPEGDYVLLTVEDTGQGMSEDVQAKVFEPFFTTKPAGRGTGLGLSTVYGIVKQAGGYIWLYSEIGQGTAFKILLPRDESEAPPALTRTNEHRIQSLTASILLVEDQGSVRAALCRSLRNAGFVVHEAEAAARAREILQSGTPIDLILTDMMMPGETGAEFASDELVVARKLPVIIMSGYSEEFTSREWKLPANCAFIDKPVAPAHLIRMVSNMLG